MFAPTTGSGIEALLSTLPRVDPGKAIGQFVILATYTAGTFDQLPDHYTGSCSLPIVLDDPNGVTYGKESIDVNLSY
jgi:hypothetical protein